MGGIPHLSQNKQRYPKNRRHRQDIMISQVNFEYLRYKLGYTRDIPMHLVDASVIHVISNAYGGLSLGYTPDILYVWWFIPCIYMGYT